MTDNFVCSLQLVETGGLVNWVNDLVEGERPFPFHTAQQIAAKLGAYFDNQTGQTQFGFWVPDLVEQGIEEIW